ncbi:MAG TPA: class I tRNA ligase family protein, partial [Acidimicrobiales bacterium]
SPHLTAELWEIRHPDQRSVHEQQWPGFDAELVREETVTLVVQVNGKVRDKVEVDAGLTEEDAQAIALALPKIAAALDGSTPKRVIARPPRLVNIVL